MQSASKHVFFDKYAFEVCAYVYEPAEDSFLFAEHLDVKIGTTVLDMGTGTGILGILAAQHAGSVLSVDVNPFAVRCARRNSQINRAQDSMSFLQSDLFTALDKTAKFDQILFNAPYLPTDNIIEKAWIEHAWTGGTTGREVIDRFISQATAYLGRTGEIMLMQSNLANVEVTISSLKANGMSSEIVVELPLPFFEKLILIRATFLNK